MSNELGPVPLQQLPTPRREKEPSEILHVIHAAIAR